MSSSNPTGDVTINNLYLGELLMQILIFATRMAPLAHIHKYVNNTTAQGWANRCSVSTASSVGTILWELSLVDRRKHIYASIGRVPRGGNNTADAALRLIHLPDRKFLSHFCTNFPQSKPCCMPPLISACRQKLTTMLDNKQSTRGYREPS